jgi:hypothetical protein
LPNYSRPLSLGHEIHVLVPPPIAGANFVWTSSSQYLHQIISICFLFTADATAISRAFQLTLDDGTDVLWRAFQTQLATASQAIRVAFSSGVATGNAISTVGGHAGLPTPHQFTGVNNIRSIVNSIQAADAITDIHVHERIWIP